MDYTTDIEITIKARELALLIADRASALVALADSEAERNRVEIELARTERTLDGYRDRNVSYVSRAHQDSRVMATLEQERNDARAQLDLVRRFAYVPAVPGVGVDELVGMAKIPAIQLVRNRTTLDLKGAKDYVDALLAKGTLTWDRDANKLALA